MGSEMCIRDSHSSEQQGLDLIAELQFCYIMVLTIGNYSCFEQWKRILTLLLTSYNAVSTHAKMYLELFKTLRIQLEHCDDVDGGLFDLSDQRNNSLARNLVDFKRHMDEDTSFPGAVKKQFLRLEIFLQDSFHWDLSSSYLRKGVVQLEDGEQVELELSDLEDEDERGDFAPVIVDEQDAVPSNER